MTQEIVDAVRALEQEKGIAADTLMDALADAQLGATAGSGGRGPTCGTGDLAGVRVVDRGERLGDQLRRLVDGAEVDLDHETGDFRVFELILPAELEEKLLEEAAAEQERTINPETGEYNEPEEPELDPEMLAPYEDQIETRDVTPEGFGRIAAQNLLATDTPIGQAHR